MSDLPFDVGEQPTSRTAITVTERKCLHPRKFRAATGEGYMLCTRCDKHISFADSRRSKNNRKRGGAAELVNSLDDYLHQPLSGKRETPAQREEREMRERVAKLNAEAAARRAPQGVA